MSPEISWSYEELKAGFPKETFVRLFVTTTAFAKPRVSNPS